MSGFGRSVCGGKVPPQNLLVKSNSWIHRPGKGWKQLNQYSLALGEVVLLQGEGEFKKVEI